jgi:hypothetical protein
MLKAEIPTNDFTQLDEFFFWWYVKIDRSMMIGTLWTEQKLDKILVQLGSRTRLAGTTPSVL